MDAKLSMKDSSGIQSGRDTNVNIGLCIKRDLSTSSAPIRSQLIESSDLSENSDTENTVLIQKLKNGGFNITFRKMAVRRKLDALSVVINYSKTESGKSILNDIYENLLSIINLKYISQLNDGESLKSSISEILEDLSSIIDKYKEQINIDEAFLEGLLYIATSRCALRWRMEDTDENTDDN